MLVVSVAMALEIDFLGRLPAQVSASAAWTANGSNVVGVSAHCCGGAGLRLGDCNLRMSRDERQVCSWKFQTFESSEAAVRAAQNANKLSGRCLAVKVPRQNFTAPIYLPDVMALIGWWVMGNHRIRSRCCQDLDANFFRFYHQDVLGKTRGVFGLGSWFSVTRNDGFLTLSCRIDVL